MDTETWIENVEALTEERLHTPARPKSLTVVFDPGCALCRRCRRWMLGQSAFVPITFVPCTEEQARRKYGAIPWVGDELIVVSDTGEVWVGPAAFLICLWALEEWRQWSYRLAGPAFAPLAERFFLALSSKRRSISALLDTGCSDGTCHVSYAVRS